MAQTFETFTDTAETPELATRHAGAPAERLARSRALYETFARGLGGLGFMAIWGLAAGAAAPRLALANIYKVPMVVALSLLVALPGVLVTRHLLRLQLRPLEIVRGLVVSAYRASLVLVGFAPLLGVYAYTSQNVAPWLAQASALLALLCGGVAWRAELGRLTAPRKHLWLLGTAAAVLVGLSLLQLVSLATPVLTLPTVFGSGIDGVLR